LSKDASDWQGYVDPFAQRFLNDGRRIVIPAVAVAGMTARREEHDARWAQLV
jgi:hypothetical protein